MSAGATSPLSHTTDATHDAGVTSYARCTTASRSTSSHPRSGDGASPVRVARTVARTVSARPAAARPLHHARRVPEFVVRHRVEMDAFVKLTRLRGDEDGNVGGGGARGDDGGAGARDDGAVGQHGGGAE